MEQNLKIEEYKDLLESITSLCDKMPEIIMLNYFDSNQYLYSLYHEAFNSIKGVCVLFGNGGLIPQAATVLRMAIEQTATIRVLETNKDLQPIYKEHKKLRFALKDLDSSEKKKKVKEHFGERITSSDRPLEYLEYGWMKSIKKEYGLNSLIDLSKIQEDEAIKHWKDQLNHFVHGTIEFTNLLTSIDAPIIYAHALILIVAKLLDNLICDFHNDNKFNFIIDDIDYRKKFIDAYKATEEEIGKE